MRVTKQNLESSEVPFFSVANISAMKKDTNIPGKYFKVDEFRTCRYGNGEHISTGHLGEGDIIRKAWLAWDSGSGGFCSAAKLSKLVRTQGVAFSFVCSSK